MLILQCNKKRICLKLIAFIIAQVFFITSLGYAEPFSNENLRIPIGQSKGRFEEGYGQLTSPAQIESSQVNSLFNVTPSFLTEKGLRFTFIGSNQELALANYRLVAEVEGDKFVIQAGLVDRGSYAINGLIKSGSTDPRTGKPRVFIITEQPKVDEENMRLMIASCADDIVNAYFFGKRQKVTIVTTKAMESFIEEQLKFVFFGIDEAKIREIAPNSAEFIITNRSAFSKFNIDDMVEFVHFGPEGTAKAVPVYLNGDKKSINVSIDKTGRLIIVSAGTKEYTADLNNLPKVEISGYKEDIPSHTSERIPGTIICLGRGLPAGDGPTSGMYVSLVPGKYGAILDTGFGTYETFRRLKESGAIPATEKLILFYSHCHLDHIGDLLQFLLNEEVTIVALPVVMQQLQDYFEAHLKTIRNNGFNELSHYVKRLVIFKDKGFDEPSFLHLSDMVDDYNIQEIGYDVEIGAFITRHPPYSWMYRLRQVDIEGQQKGFAIGYTGDMKYDKALDATHQKEFGQVLAADVLQRHREAFVKFIKDLEALIIEFSSSAAVHNTPDNVADLINDIKVARGDGSCPQMLGFHYDNPEDPQLLSFADTNKIILLQSGIIVTPKTSRHEVEFDSLRFFNILRAIFRDEQQMTMFLEEIKSKGAEIREFSEDTKIVSEEEQGGPGSELFFLVNGTAEVARKGEVIANVLAGNIIGENIIRGEHANATVMAQKGSIVIVVKKHVLDRMDGGVRDKLIEGLERISKARESIEGFIKAHKEREIFKGVSAAIIANLALVAEEVIYTAQQAETGAVLVREGDSLESGIFANSLAIVIEGSVDIFVGGNKVAERRAGELILEMAVAEGKGAKRNATVKPGRDGVTLYKITIGDLDFIKEFYPVLYWFIYTKARQITEASFLQRQSL